MQGRSFGHGSDAVPQSEEAGRKYARFSLRVGGVAHSCETYYLCYKVNVETGRPSVTLQSLGDVESLMCNFYFNMAARTSSEQIRP